MKPPRVLKPCIDLDLDLDLEFYFEVNKASSPRSPRLSPEQRAQLTAERPKRTSMLNFDARRKKKEKAKEAGEDRVHETESLDWALSRWMKYRP